MPPLTMSVVTTVEVLEAQVEARVGKMPGDQLEDQLNVLLAEVRTVSLQRELTDEENAVRGRALNYLAEMNPWD